ncbi:Hok/Gef family protein [Salmonella enterica]|uniref:Hok/Gef family protein n=2 Tax=Salmonella enterica TaxID=28901 RepID=A0A743Z7T1_SALER|nr:Hok/Gef family protein [Salmonella enterica subsp. enterica serovar Java]EBR9313560.1 Hok/Gef family protein [Salmonella enterica subsp. enterica serovar Muenchen]EDQ3993749.1 Hok/Gef family protein [Salmonella enterica subsp. enterica]EDS8889866.1 Hok/Gef family protein [Salmonella enterica]EDX3512275.1 Hok/Gef family protein [Salmonella enterica subsp. enterica serovar Adelaide]EEE5035633.1 Hok/Gef family protein [Salmonella enterica subsp. diarizonae]EHG9470526.1 Hok/Gef family protein 
MLQKPLLIITIFIVVVLIFSMLHGSLCEVRMNFWGAEFAAFLQCKQ